MEKIVKTGRTAVFTLDGTECRLTFAQKYRGFDIENRSDGDILVSFRSGSVEGDDGTMTIPAGRSFNFMQMYETDTIYLTGTGKVAIAAKNDSNPNFKAAQGGGEKSKITPEKLGYVSGAQYFFDGIYNFPNKHADIALAWIDIANDNVMTRTAGNVYDDHYDKLSGSSSIFTVPAITYDNFTVEVVCTINSVSTSECDIASNFDHSGFGIYTQNGLLYAEIHDSSSYVSAELSSFSTGVKYVIQIVYDGSTFTAYINGAVIGTYDVSLGNYRKSSKAFALGGSVSGSFSDGAYNFYRFAVYDKALTAAEIAQNYNADTARFDI